MDFTVPLGKALGREANEFRIIVCLAVTDFLIMIGIGVTRAVNAEAGIVGGGAGGASRRRVRENKTAPREHSNRTKIFA